MTKKNKHTEPIKLDEELSFEEAMSKIAKAKKKDVEKAIKDHKPDKKHHQEEGGEDN